jgi:hypothetical protein
VVALPRGVADRSLTARVHIDDRSTEGSVDGPVEGPVEGSMEAGDRSSSGRP